jgi:hypothetical protein
MPGIMASEPEMFQDDPLGLQRLESELQIEKLRQEIKEVTGEEFLSGSAPDCEPGLEKAFLEHVLALETRGFLRPFEVLLREGVNLPPPEELDDASLARTLQGLIDELARRRLFLERTNHLSDRELYSWLWKDALREELMGFGLPFGNCHLDVLGGCSEEDLILSMRYYADEEERARWAMEFPNVSMPAREKPPFDRDRHLPQPEPPGERY